MKITFLTLSILMWINQSIDGQDECKVQLDKIGNKYEGECKKGLAHGNGIASGEDYYEGQFKKGYPDGNGVYKWANGNIYIGEWKNGREEGKGKFVIPLDGKDSLVEGFWRNGRYIGTSNVPPYSVDFNRNIERYAIKNLGETNSIRIRFLRLGGNNPDISNIVVGHDSGSQRILGNQVIIEEVVFPVKCTLRYTTTTKMSNQPINGVFNFTINDPGSWEISLTN